MVLDRLPELQNLLDSRTEILGHSEQLRGDVA